ncbi:hypothetical protein JB92DRAFT_3056095 [Gautieria morchelliformis]|nr:hypothetical protein JB92DRAFT_3056095 [Gautieria morchelliformis]
MFGCLLPGRALQTNLQQIDETHAIFTLENPASINHLCVFLLGTVPFPDGYAATVHFHWPGRGFQVLGMLSNAKPSAIFRLRGTYTPADGSSGSHAAFSSVANGATMNDVSATGDLHALLGLSIEPLSSALAQCASLPGTSSHIQPQPSGPAGALTRSIDPTALAEKVVKHLFNYLSSFVSGGGGLSPEAYVPLAAITKWYENFLGKVKAGGIGFLERDD